MFLLCIWHEVLKSGPSSPVNGFSQWLAWGQEEQKRSWEAILNTNLYWQCSVLCVCLCLQNPSGSIPENQKCSSSFLTKLFVKEQPLLFPTSLYFSEDWCVAGCFLLSLYLESLHNSLRVKTRNRMSGSCDFDWSIHLVDGEYFLESPLHRRVEKSPSNVILRWNSKSSVYIQKLSFFLFFIFSVLMTKSRTWYTLGSFPTTGLHCQLQKLK